MNAITGTFPSMNMEDLAKWCFTSGKMLIGDEKAQDFSNKVKALR